MPKPFSTVHFIAISNFESFNACSKLTGKSSTFLVKQETIRFILEAPV